MSKARVSMRQGNSCVKKDCEIHTETNLNGHHYARVRLGNNGKWKTQKPVLICTPSTCHCLKKCGKGNTYQHKLVDAVATLKQNKKMAKFMNSMQSAMERSLKKHPKMEKMVKAAKKGTAKAKINAGKLKKAAKKKLGRRPRTLRRRPTRPGRRLRTLRRRPTRLGRRPTTPRRRPAAARRRSGFLTSVKEKAAKKKAAASKKKASTKKVATEVATKAAKKVATKTAKKGAKKIAQKVAKKTAKKGAEKATKTKAAEKKKKADTQKKAAEKKMKTAKKKATTGKKKPATGKNKAAEKKKKADAQKKAAEKKMKTAKKKKKGGRRLLSLLHSENELLAALDNVQMTMTGCDLSKTKMNCPMSLGFGSPAYNACLNKHMENILRKQVNPRIKTALGCPGEV